MTKRQLVPREPEGQPDGPASFAGQSGSDYASFLKISEAERELLKERIAEADKGVFISAEAMHRWIESWGTDDELPPPEPDIFPQPRS